MTLKELKYFHWNFFNRVLPAGAKRWQMLEDVQYALISLPVEELLKMPNNLKKFHEEYMKKRKRLFGGEE